MQQPTIHPRENFQSAWHYVYRSAGPFSRLRFPPFVLMEGNRQIPYSLRVQA